MEHYVVQIDGKYLTTSMGKDAEDARKKALSSHAGAYKVQVIGEVNAIYNLVKPFETAEMIPKKSLLGPQLDHHLS